MLWARISSVLVVASLSACFVLFKTGKLERLERENGIHMQTIIQKEQAAEQARQMAAEAELEKSRIAEEARKAYEALEAAQKARKDSESKVNELLAEIEVIKHEDEELKAWSDREHPVSVVRVLNAAADGGSARTNSNHQDSDHLAPSDIGTELRDW